MDHAARSAIAKAARRLLPFLILCYAVNFLDLVNVGFAALSMNEDLGFSPSVFGAGAGIFFVGYLLFEIPSNLALQRFGARVWIARIMVSWGIIATAMALVGGETSFYVMRFLLGVAEAGFFPGIILYLSYWFPARERARIVSLFMAAVPLATLVGGPISGALLELHGVAGSRAGIACSLSRGCRPSHSASRRTSFSTTSPSRHTGCQARNGRRFRTCLPRRRRRRGRRATTRSAMR